MRHAGLQRQRIDRDAAAMVDRDPGGFEVQPVGGADPAGSEQQHLGNDVAAVGQSGDDAAALAALDRCDGGAQSQRDIAVAQLVHELLDQFLVDEVEEGRPRFDQRHRDIERRENGGVFDPDHAGADHS
ncbi:MAG: hypothetical protein JWR80_605 [Bradyrhizobium sp.]|nr:hypothetical protein [Bradyrhizobium sp.]